MANVAESTQYIIECRHASGSSHWDREPGEGPFATREEAEKVVRWFERNEPIDAEGAALEYRVSEAS